MAHLPPQYPGDASDCLRRGAVRRYIRAVHTRPVPMEYKPERDVLERRRAQRCDVFHDGLHGDSRPLVHNVLQIHLNVAISSRLVSPHAFESVCPFLE